MALRALLIVALATPLGGCSVDVSLIGKRCAPDGGCPDGLVCDASNTCQSSASPTTTHAADWTGAMIAVYRFEPNGLTVNAVDGGAPLVERNSPPPGPDAIEGTGSATLDFELDSGFDATDPALAPESDFTIGAWLLSTNDDASSPNALQRRTPDAGYAIERNVAATSASCVMRSPMGVAVAEGPSDRWPFDTWAHVACRYRRDGDEARLTTFVESTPGPEADAMWVQAAASVPLAVGGDGYAGRIDELFVAPGALSTQSIARLRACGVDGTACTCDPDDPAGYTSCGRADDCATIAPCDQVTP